MKRCVMIVALLMLGPACATSPSGAARTPAASGLVPGIGTWAGTMASLDMATASGTADAPARVTIMADGRFTLTSSGGTVVAGVARRAGNSLVLDGTVTAGDPMAVGRAVSFVLEPRGPNALFGDGQTFHLGHRIDTGIALRRV
jgi:hypothetical protein